MKAATPGQSWQLAEQRYAVQAVDRVILKAIGLRASLNQFCRVHGRGVVRRVDTAQPVRANMTKYYDLT